MDVHKGTIHSIEPDVYEKRIVTASSDGVVRVFENTELPDKPVKMELECELVSDSGPCTKAVFVNQGELIVSSYYSGKLILWKREANNYSIKAEKEIFSGSINDISSVFVGDVVKIYCACSDGNVRIVEIDSSGTFKQKEIFAHRFGVNSIHANSSYFVTGGLDYSVVVWENDKELARLRDHKGYVRDVAIANNGIFDIFCFASGGEDHKVIIYTKDVNDFRKQEIDMKEPVYSLSWSKSGFSLSVGYGDGQFKCFVPGDDNSFREVVVGD